MVAIEDALDQYFMRNPADFFRRSVEAAVLDNSSETILKAHLPCAVAELPMKSDEVVFEKGTIDPILNILEEEGKVRYWQKGDMWYPRRRYPHREVSIRQAGARFTIYDEEGKLVGESGSARVMHELHPGAVYLHRGSQYVVRTLDLGTKEVRLRSAENLTYYTSAIANEDTEILSTVETMRVKNFSISTGKLKITESILGYRKKDLHTRRLLGEYLLELPPEVFATAGIWLKVSEDILNEVDGEGWSVAGALHALEHSMIAALPLYALSDRMDLGGVSYTINPELESAAVFIYDAHEGGVGITRRGFDVVEKWFTSTMVLMEECGCEVSCPSCTQDPRCGNNNEPLDKRGAILILKRWLGRE
jgi:DEAD/DEAH box helicase domain-containing protein